MLLALYPGSREADHSADSDAFFAGRPEGRPPLAEVFICERPTGGLAGFLELSVRDYARGAPASPRTWKAGTWTPTYAAGGWAAD